MPRISYPLAFSGFVSVCYISPGLHWLCSTGHPTAGWVLQEAYTVMELEAQEGFLGSNNCERKKGRKQDRAREADDGTVLSKTLPAQYGSSSYVFLLEKFSRNGYDLDPQPGPVIGCRFSWEEHALGNQHLTQAEELPRNILNLVKKLRQTLKELLAGSCQLTTVLAAGQRVGSCLTPHVCPRIVELVESTSLLKYLACYLSPN